MVTKAEKLRRDISGVVRARQIKRAETERGKAISTRRQQVEEQTKRLAEQQARLEAEAKRPGTFDVTVIERGGGRTPKTVSVVKTFATREAAERFIEEERFEFADRDTPVGIRETRSAAEKRAVTLFQGMEVIGPPPSERGLE